MNATQRRMYYWCGPLAAVVAVLLYWLVPRDSVDGQWRRERDLWASRGIHHYSYRLQEWPNVAEAVVEIKNGKTVKYQCVRGDTLASNEPATMETYFGYVAQDLREARLKQSDHVDVTYDSTYGFPCSVQVFTLGYQNATDSVPGWAITDFRVLS